MEAIRVYTRYDLPDEKGETRRERNIKFGFEDKNPEVEIPYEGEYIWELYAMLSNAIHRVDMNGYYYSLPPSEILAWCKLRDLTLTPFEYEVISAMDNSFCNEINKDKNAKYNEKLQKLDEESKRRKR